LLKCRVAICLLINDGVLFRSKKFVLDYRYTINHVGTDAADEVFMIDVTRSGPSEESRKTMQTFADKCYCPMTMGGHIEALDDIKRFLDMGTDNIVLRRSATPAFVEAIRDKFGSQICTVGIDVGQLMTADGAAKMAIDYEKWGAGQIFLQSVERDGSLSGYDLDAIRKVSSSVKIPVAVGTSCGSAQHMREAFEAGATLAATANIHHYTPAAILGFRKQLSEYKHPDGSPLVRPL
jgi:cyclase